MGEVLPAELYQQVADYQRSAVDHLEQDHAVDWRGMPTHYGLRWARAVAYIEMPPLSPDEGMTRPQHGGRILFAAGFAEAPEVVRDTKHLPHMRGDLPPYRAWWLRWKLKESRPQQILYGVRTRGNTAGSPLTLFPVDRGKGEGELTLGPIVLRTSQEEEWEELSEQLMDITHVTLIIR